MAHAQKPDFFFRRNGRVHLTRLGRQFSRLLAAEVCASVVVMRDTPCSEVVRRVLASHSIRQFPLHFLSRASPCTMTFKLDSTTGNKCGRRVRPSPGFFFVTIEVIKIWVFTAVMLVIRCFRDAALCGVVNSYGCFGGP